MKPYINIRLTENPDVSDIKAQARKSSVGRLSERGGDFKSYTRSTKTRAVIRRALKKADRNRQNRQNRRNID